MKLTKEQIGWLMELVNDYDAVSHPYALDTYVELAKAFNAMPDDEDTSNPTEMLDTNNRGWS